MLWEIGENYNDNDIEGRILKEAIEDKKYLHILDIKEWKIIIHDYNVSITASQKAKLSILKRIIMQTILQMKISKLEEISSLLHVDLLFVEDIVSQLISINVVEVANAVYRLTKTGLNQLEAGITFSEPINENYTFQFSPNNGTTLLKEERNIFIKDNWELESYRYEENIINLTGKEISEKELRTYLDTSGEVFEVGGIEKLISKIEPIQLRKTSYAKCIEYQLFDIIEEKVYTRIWNGATGRWDRVFENKINQMESDFLKQKYVEEINKITPLRYQYLRESFSESLESKNKSEISLEVLRGLEIRKRFLKSFSEVKVKMLIVAPWISRNVVDHAMLNLLDHFASQNKTLFISWGYNKDFNKEDRLPDSKLIESMTSITHADGTQAVFVRWFGNLHNKEIVIDDKILLLGSHNWLSYRGEYNIRGESVTVLNDKTIIEETTMYIEENFIDALEKELDFFIVTNNHGRLILKNWTKELILLDSELNRRKRLSDTLVHFLKKNNETEIIQELATLWAKYNREEFGCRDHLRELLEDGEEELARAYYQICIENIPSYIFWKESEELRIFDDWLKEQEMVHKDIHNKSNKNKSKKQKNRKYE